MADPLQDLIDPPADPNPAPPAAADPAAPAAPTGVTISPEDYDRLKQAADDTERLKAQLEQFQAMQYRAPEPTADPNPADPNAEFFVDPTKATKQIIDQTVTPYARQMAAQIGAMTILNYKSGKTGDRFYAGVAPYFDQKAQGIDKSWLGSLPPDAQQKVLTEAWLAAKGAYLDEYEKKNPAKPAVPPNIGGGGSSSGGSIAGKKTLQELDPWTYSQAVRQGWSQEKIDKFAADLIKEMEE